MSQISADNSLLNAASRSPVNRFQEIESEDFIRIIFTELQNQDPFQPNDSAALLDQLNSIRSIESDLQLIERLDSLVTQNQLAAAGNLIGTIVTGLNSFAERASGTVVAALREGEDVILELDNGARIPFDQLEEVQRPAQPAPEKAAT